MMIFGNNISTLPEYTVKERYLKLNGTGIFFEEYSGEIQSSEISHFLDTLITKNIPNIYNIIKEYNDSELLTFYDNNSKNLINMLGIDNKEDFLNFANKLQKCNIDFNSWESLQIMEETFSDESDIEGYSYVEYIVTYKNEKNVKFCLYVQKKDFSNKMYIVDIVN